MKNKMIFVGIVLLLVLGLLLASVGCTAPTTPSPTTSTPTPVKPALEKITFGATTAYTGFMASNAASVHWSSIGVWVDDVNAKGGIYVKEFDKRIPVEFKFYDDKSDPGVTVKMYEKLILADKVDFVVAPCGTAWHFAAAPLANEYGYPMIQSSAESNALVTRAKAGELPYFFQLYAAPMDYCATIVELLSELGIKSVAVLYAGTLYGIEHMGSIGSELDFAGISVPIAESYPMGIMDLSPLLQRIKTANVDALVAFSYDADGMLLTEQMNVLGINPKLVLVSSTSWASTAFLDKFGKAGMEGIMGILVGTPTMPFPGIKEFFEKYRAEYGREADYGNSAYVYASMQIFEQAIEKAGTLDRARVRDVMATETFSTIMGEVKFVNNYNIHMPGIIGQWHDGKYGVVAPPESRTMEVIYPKPEWPK